MEAPMRQARPLDDGGIGPHDVPGLQRGPDRRGEDMAALLVGLRSLPALPDREGLLELAEAMLA